MKKLTPLRIVFVYITTYVLWIIGTDLIVTNLSVPHHLKIKASIAKGIFSVLVSSLFLYWIIYKYTIQLKHANNQLLEETTRFESIVSSVGDGIMSLSKDYKITYQNNIHVGIMGQFAGEYCYSAFHKRTELCDDCPVARSYADGHIHRTERMVVKDGELRFFEIMAAPVRNSSGQIVGGAEVVREITAKRRLERAIIENEKHYRMLFESSPISIFQEDMSEVKKELDALADKGVTDLIEHFEKNPDEKLPLVEKIQVIDVNKSGVKLFKAKSKSDLHGGIKKILTSDAIDVCIFGICRLYQGDAAFDAEYGLTNLEGEYLQLYNRWLVVNENQKTWSNVLVSRINLTPLRRSEKFLNEILRSVDEGFIVIDRDLKILSANAAFLRMAGKSEGDVIGNQCHEVSHKDRKPCFERGEDCPVRKTFETGKSYTSIHEHHQDNGNSVFTEIKSYPIRDMSGEVVSVIETMMDITEKRKLQDELSKAQKLESIGLLAGGIAHDFNNLLTGILGYVSLIKMKSGNDVHSYVREAEVAIDQAKSLTQQLLTFSKGGEPIKKIIDVLPTVKDALQFGLSGRNVDFKITADGNLPAIEADAGQIKQVVQNIIINAADSMPKGGTVKVNVSTIRSAEGDANSNQGRYVAISIQDRGIGIPNNHISSIFDPYFTTKKEGSGLGLATSFAIVKKHGGTINVDSAPGKGSTFTVLLPVSNISAQKVEFKEDVVGGHGRILVLEDDSIVRAVCKEMLTELGYESDFSVNGEETVDKYIKAIQSEKPYDFLILDLTIRGGMGGQDTIKKLLEINPQVKAIVSTGYAENQIMASYEQYGFKARLAKPYKIEEMSRVLKNMI